MLLGAGITSLLGMPFPVTVIQRLHEFLEGEQIIRLSNLCYLILEMIQKTVIELESECMSAPGDVHSQLVELSDVLGNLLVVGHLEVH